MADRTRVNAHGNSWSSRWSASHRLAIALGLLLTVALLPLDFYPGQLLAMAVVLGLWWSDRGRGGLQGFSWPGWIGPLGLLLFLSLAWSTRGMGWRSLGLLGAVASSWLVVDWLRRTTTPRELLLTAKAWGIPSIMLSIVVLTLRYISLFASEADRLRRARAARRFPSALSFWRDGPGVIGQLFLRSMDRSERVHRAMIARGWTGEASFLLGIETDDSGHDG